MKKNIKNRWSNLSYFYVLLILLRNIIQLSLLLSLPFSFEKKKSVITTLIKLTSVFKCNCFYFSGRKATETITLINKEQLSFNFHIKPQSLHGLTSSAVMSVYPMSGCLEPNMR